MCFDVFPALVKVRCNLLLYVLIGELNYVLRRLSQLSDSVMDQFKLLLLLEENCSTKYSASCTLDFETSSTSRVPKRATKSREVAPDEGTSTGIPMFFKPHILFCYVHDSPFRPHETSDSNRSSAAYSFFF